MKIKKAVIPAAGFGTRILPATKSMPKEMYPIVDRPAIEYIVREAVQSGIEDILIVTSKGKEILQDHFDKNSELENILIKKGKNETAKTLNEISNLANIYFVRQKEPKGLGDAIYQAKSFIGNEPFAVLYGDDVMYYDDTPVLKQLINAYDEFCLAVVAAKEVPEKDISKYGSLKIEKIRDNIFKCTDMIEKPRPSEVMSLYSILGRCILPSEIFKILENTKEGYGGEIQLTDAMKVLAKRDSVIAVDFIGERYDMGSKIGILKAEIEMGLRHSEIKDELRKYILDLSKKI